MSIIDRYSPRLVSAFLLYLRRYLARNFHAVRAAGSPPPLDRPTVFYTNHASWWDPLVLLWVLRELYPDVRIFGPMDAVALRRYAFFERCGAFGIAAEAWSGAAQFLRASKAVLAQPSCALCVTAEGRFVDPRARPVRLARGVSHLLHAGIARQAVPIALEYPFWHERKPEVLLEIGQAVRQGDRTIDAQHALLESALEHALDALAERSISRDENGLEKLLDGAYGVGGIYDLYRHARARAAGRRFDSSHGSLLK